MRVGSVAGEVGCCSDKRYRDSIASLSVVDGGVKWLCSGDVVPIQYVNPILRKKALLIE